MKKNILTTIHEYLIEQSNTLLAPNGSKSNLSKKLYYYVRTDEFKKWFGDWESNPTKASKIVDDNGEPLLVYHGSKNSFNEFDTQKQKNGWLGKGFYFTKDKNSAKKHGRSVIKAFLNIRNPFIVRGNDTNDVDYEIRTKHKTQINSDVSIVLKQNNWDGVIFNHWDVGNMISCFEPNQIRIV